MSATAWRRLRQGAQLLSLLLFLALFAYATAQRPQRLWADLFARLDPLILLTANAAGRRLLGGLLLALVPLALTFLFGRFWCGWFCPLGTLLEWLGPRRARPAAPPERWRAAKVLLLVAVIGAALLGNQTLLFLDPITLLNRTLATAVWPGLHRLILAAEAGLYRASFLWGPLDAVHRAVVAPVFGVVQPHFYAAWLSVGVFAALVALNWRAQRFWCRYLCPLGALLGLVSRVAILRRQVGGACTGCARCARACPTGTVNPADAFQSDPAECTVCLDCLVDCPEIQFGFRLRSSPSRPAKRSAYDPTRRQLLGAIGASVVGVALTGVEPVVRHRTEMLIRPPGAEEHGFAALCVRCAACVRVCPTQGLQPSLLEAGAQNLLTPRLVPRLGPCSYACNACGQVCPTGAIPGLALPAKQTTAIGLAAVDRDRCLPWAYGLPCIICEEACPVPDKAIQLELFEGKDALGQPLVLQRPRVVRELCIGCGLCEFKCPMAGSAAIRVYSPTAAGIEPGLFSESARTQRET